MNESFVGNVIPHGRKLGIDVGKRRIGVAISDPLARIATPLETLFISANDIDSENLYYSAIKQLNALIGQYDIVALVVGLPFTLKKQSGISVGMVKDLLKCYFNFRDKEDEFKTSKACPKVYLQDERLSTASAAKMLVNAKVSSRKHKQIIDQVAAVNLLQDWLDTYSSTLNQRIPKEIHEENQIPG